MMILVVLTTILSLLALCAAPEVNAGTTHFEYYVFDSKSIRMLNFLFNATTNTGDTVLLLTDWCPSTYVCRGQIVFFHPILFIDRSLKRTYSFSTSFVFTVKIPDELHPGEGFVFFLIGDPYSNTRSGVGDYFGALPSIVSPNTPTIAIEFDTLKNNEISDMDDNHIGVDINHPTSIVQESCNLLNIPLRGGQKIKAWVDYHDSIKKLQVRLANWTSTVDRPNDPLIDMDLDLADVVNDTMYVGFSGVGQENAEQEIDLYAWTFLTALESPAPPPPKSPRQSKVEKTILIFVIGGGLGLMLAAGCCFWFGYCWRGKSALAAKEQPGDSKNRKEKSESAARMAGDTEEDRRKKFEQERHYVLNDDMEAGTGQFASLLSTSSKSVKIVSTNKDAPDVTITATSKKRKGEKVELMPKRIQSARQDETDRAETHAFKNGGFDIEVIGSPFRRRLQSFDGQESVDVTSKRGTGRTPATSILGREIRTLPEDETAGRDDLLALSRQERQSGMRGPLTASAASPSFRDTALSQTRRQTSPGGSSTAAALPVSSVDVKRRQTIQSRKPESVSTPERSLVSSPSGDSDRTPRKNPKSSSTLGGTIMYTNTLYDSPRDESRDPSSPRPPRSAEPDLYMEENINIRPPPENIFDRQLARTHHGEGIVERIFQVPITKEPEVDFDADRIFYIPDSSDVSQRDTITPVTRTAARTPSQRRGGSILSSPEIGLAGITTPRTAITPVTRTAARTHSQSHGGSRLSSPKTGLTGITTPRTAGPSGSSLMENTEESERQRIQQIYHSRD